METGTLTPKHPRWSEFIDRLAEALDEPERRCLCRGFESTLFVLREMEDLDVGRSLDALRGTRSAEGRFPHCDCDVLGLDASAA